MRSPFYLRALVIPMSLISRLFMIHAVD